MSKAWMPLYVGDYLGDTAHLSQGQHGAYLLFIMHYWQRGSLPGEKDECYCIARAMDKQSRCNADRVLEQFFVLKGGSYRHSRIDAELARAQESYEKRSGAALARWGKGKHKQSNSNGHALHEQSQSQSLNTPQTPLSGGLTPREFKRVNAELTKITKAMEGASYDVAVALEKACVRAGVDFERARPMLGEGAA